jgi:hypothetical protein
MRKILMVNVYVEVHDVIENIKYFYWLVIKKRLHF